MIETVASELRVPRAVHLFYPSSANLRENFVRSKFCSDDVRWFGSPKLKEGQQGVFLLHRTEEAALCVRGFTALDALDFQPIQQRDSIKKLIRAAHSH